MTEAPEQEQPESNEPQEVIPANVSPVTRFQATHFQIATLLGVVNNVSALLFPNNDPVEGVELAGPEGGSIMAAGVTVCKALDRLDAILDDEARWKMTENVTPI